jgi:hypothetical protein
MVASAGETDRDLACTQLTQILRVYNIMEVAYYNFKTYNILYYFIMFIVQIIIL